MCCFLSHLVPYSQDEADVVEKSEEIICREPSQPATLTFEELLDVIRSGLGCKRQEVACGRFDERFLSGHNHPPPMSHPFLPELHAEGEEVMEEDIFSSYLSFPASKLFKYGGIA